ncbi:MAG: PD-(D/E)XK nuclease family protein, partial [Candidatus Micrarchaeaceae archaeon]
EKLARTFVSFANRYNEYKRQKHCCDYYEAAGSFNGETSKKYVIVLNVSDMNPIQQEIIRKIKGKSKCIMTVSESTLMEFAGADPKLKQLLGKDKTTLDYYYENAEIKVPENTERSYEIVNGEESVSFSGTAKFIVTQSKDDSAKVAAEYALESAFKGKRSAILTDSNFLVEQIAELLEHAGANYSAKIKAHTDEQILKEVRSFVLGLLSTDKNAIINALQTHLSPVPLNVVLNNRDAFLEGKEVEAFKPFLDMQKEIHTLEDIIKVLERCASEFIDFKARSTVYAVAKSLEIYARSTETGDLGAFIGELGAFILLTRVYSPYIKAATRSPEIIVTTPFDNFGTNFDTVIYVEANSFEKDRRRLKSAVEAIAEVVASLHGKQYCVSEEKETLEKARAALAAAREGGDFYHLRKHFQTRNIEAREPEMLWPEDLPEIRLEAADAVRSYLIDMHKISFSLLYALDNPNKFVEAFVLNYEEPDELKELGSKTHELLKLVFEKGVENLSEQQKELLVKLRKPLENAKKITETLKQEGFEQKTAEERVTVPFVEIEALLGTGIADWNASVIGAIDAVFEKNDGSIMILDFKTGETEKYADYDYDEQLTLYRMLYSKVHGVPLDKIKVAIAHIGLRGPLDSIENAGYSLKVLDESDLRRGEEKLKVDLQKAYRYHTQPDDFIKMLKNTKDLHGLLRARV